MRTRSKSKRAEKNRRRKSKSKIQHILRIFFNAGLDFLVPGSPRMSIEHAVVFLGEEGDTTARKNDCVREDMGK